MALQGADSQLGSPVGGNGHNVHSIIHQSRFSLWRKTHTTSSIPPLLSFLYLRNHSACFLIFYFSELSSHLFSSWTPVILQYLFFSKIISQMPEKIVVMVLLCFKFLKRKKEMELWSATKDLTQGTNIFGVSYGKPSVKINYIELEVQCWILFLSIYLSISLFTCLYLVERKCCE